MLFILIAPYSYLCVPNAEGISSSVPPPTTLYAPENEELTYMELLSNNQLSAIAKVTVDQYECDEWFAQRAGRITASKMKATCHTDPAFPSIKHICYPYWYRFSSEAVRSGCDHESIALELYAEDAKNNVNFHFFCLGLCFHEKYILLAATPDGVTHCDCCDYGVVEIKCPYSKKDSNPEAADCLESGSLKKDHQYYYQVQLQMFVCNVGHVDFVTYTFPNDEPVIAVERIYPDVDFLVTSIVQAGCFYTVAILSELLAK